MCLVTMISVIIGLVICTSSQALRFIKAENVSYHFLVDLPSVLHTVPGTEQSRHPPNQGKKDVGKRKEMSLSTWDGANIWNTHIFRSLGRK